MAERLDEKELVSFKEMLMANSIQVDAVKELSAMESGLERSRSWTLKISDSHDVGLLSPIDGSSTVNLARVTHH